MKNERFERLKNIDSFYQKNKSFITSTQTLVLFDDDVNYYVNFNGNKYIALKNKKNEDLELVLNEIEQRICIV